MNLRKRLAASKTINEFGASILYWYIRTCHATTRWQRIGFDEMNKLLGNGQPVMIVLWHERLFYSTYLFNRRLGKICAITTDSRMAFFGRCTLRRLGFETVMIDPKGNPVRFNREVLRRIRKGYSIAISPDGTRGPACVAKRFPIVWARKTQIPIFCVSYSVKRAFRLPTWDHSYIPFPFNRGVLIVRRWEEHVPPKASDEQIEALRVKLSSAIEDLTRESDIRVASVGKRPSNLQSL